MASHMETQSDVEPAIEYCRTCGHAKECHNLDFQGDVKEAHAAYSHGEYVCGHMTGLNSAVHCICVGWNRWV